MKTKALALLKMARLHYSVEAVLPVLLGFAIAPGAGERTGTCFLMVAVFTLLSMAAWAGNDHFDRSYDCVLSQSKLFGLHVSGGTNAAAAARLSSGEVWAFLTITTAIALIVATTIGAAVLLYVAIGAVVSLLYSWPPVRLKGKGFLGAVVVGLAYGVIPFITGWAAAGQEISARVLGNNIFD